MVVSRPLWSGENSVPAMIKRLGKNMQTASFISGRCAVPFTPFDPDLLFLLLFFLSDCTQSMSVTFCMIKKKKKKKKAGPSLTGALLAALSACIWATGASTGGTGTSSLIIFSYPAFNSPLEVMLITWIPTDWHGWRTHGHNLYFMHFAWSGNEGI